MCIDGALGACTLALTGQ
ncbi:hypothetical protein EYF80_012040 [Liparis tanakae]|uniref:Uncharacterized protein n=1 Tax=Liparis tanakae TaxID=230148 RepID=A0A4Z2IKI9_9TELE|nr:hypothetical protein EYF80_012040 [Liparis tanakae]